MVMVIIHVFDWIRLQFSFPLHRHSISHRRPTKTMSRSAFSALSCSCLKYAAKPRLGAVNRSSTVNTKWSPLRSSQILHGTRRYSASSSSSELEDSAFIKQPLAEMFVPRDPPSKKKISSAPEQCPGCGAPFQYTEPDEPGFVPSRTDETDVRYTRRHFKATPDKHLSLAEYDDKVSGLADLAPELLKHFVYVPNESPPFYADNVVHDKYAKAGSEVNQVDNVPGVVGTEADAGVTGEMSIKESRKLKYFDEEGNQWKKSAAKEEKGDGESRSGEMQSVCGRCWNLRHYKRATQLKQGPLVVAEREILEFLRKKPTALIVCVVDLTDLPSSFLNDIRRIVGRRHKIILVANKLDLLPRPIKSFTHISGRLRRIAHELGIGELDGQGIHLISAKEKQNLQYLAEDIRLLRPLGGDVYILGHTNVGKSELVNALLRTHSGANQSFKVTTSIVPGTTLGSVGIPLAQVNTGDVELCHSGNPARDSMLYDTPGITNQDQLMHLLTPEEAKVVMPNKPFTSRTYVLHAGRSLLLGALGRLDYVEGAKDHILVTVVSHVRAHIANISKVEELLERLPNGDRSDVIHVPFGEPQRLREWPRLAPATHLPSSDEPGVLDIQGTTRLACVDLVFSGGIGWLSVVGRFSHARIKVWSPNGRGVLMRALSLLPDTSKGRPEIPNVTKRFL